MSAPPKNCIDELNRALHLELVRDGDEWAGTSGLRKIIHRSLLSPLRGLIRPGLSTHGLRRGLHSYAASRLPDDYFLLRTAIFLPGAGACSGCAYLRGTWLPCGE